tara:strand:+ start:1835 stop:3193 length:1359 start_codon:yes stop_codon:yes gene_type:complete
LKEVNHTDESIQKILEVAKEKAVGNNQQDLDRIRAALKRLKFGTIELSTEQGFLKALLSGKEDDIMFGKNGAKSVEESEEYKNLHARVKQLQEENKKREKDTTETIKQAHDEYGLYVKEKEQLQKIIDEVAQLEDESKAAEMRELARTQGLQTSNRASELLDEKKTKEELQNELKELDNALRRMNRGIAQKEASCRKIDEEIAPLDAQFVELRAQSKYLIGASKAAAKESEASKALAEMSMKIQEQMKLVSALQGTELLEIGEDSISLRLASHLPETDMEAMESSRARGVGRVTHVVTLGFIEKTARLNSITLDPADAPIEDVARMFLGTTDCASALCNIRDRIAATAQRCEALAAAASRTPLKWSAFDANVRAAMTSTTEPRPVAVLEVPLEWPKVKSAEIRVVNVENVPSRVAGMVVQTCTGKRLRTIGETLQTTIEAEKMASSSSSSSK